MKIWAKTIKDHRIQQEVVQEFASARPSDILGWTGILAELCKPLDVAVPVLLKKHISELRQFSTTAFKQGDFMETIAFDSLVIEIFPEKKKESKQEYFYS